MVTYVNLTPGDPAPWFKQRSFANPSYYLDTVAGRYIVLCFFASAGDSHSRAAIQAVQNRRRFFDDQCACFFGVSLDPKDEKERRVADQYPGYRYLWDFDGTASRLYGALSREGEISKGPVPTRRLWVVLDPTLRVLRVVPFAPDRSDIDALLSYVDSLPPPSRFAGFELQAPVLILPNAFELDFCRKLIELHETHGGEESGFMSEANGRTVAVNDHGLKRRRDYLINDTALISEIQAKFNRRVVPEILKVHQFKVTRMERYIVGCYAAEDEAHFRAHRDNTTKGTAHRRFAVSVNLNEEFDGGEVSFPEYGQHGFKPPPGGALVFSCSLLHAVSKVRRGRRYAFLPFLYDDLAAKVREANNPFLGEGVDPYSLTKQ